MKTPADYEFKVALMVITALAAVVIIGLALIAMTGDSRKTEDPFVESVTHGPHRFLLFKTGSGGTTVLHDPACPCYGVPRERPGD